MTANIFINATAKYMARELLFMVYTAVAANFEAMFHVYKVVNLLIGH